jgi:hypothetical protein
MVNGLLASSGTLAQTNIFRYKFDNGSGRRKFYFLLAQTL